jgi:hypothetical protein
MLKSHHDFSLESVPVGSALPEAYGKAMAVLSLKFVLLSISDMCMSNSK